MTRSNNKPPPLDKEEPMAKYRNFTVIIIVNINDNYYPDIYIIRTHCAVMVWEIKKNVVHLF